MDSRETGEGATARSTGDLAHKFCSRTYLVWWTNASTWCLNGWMALLAGDLSIVWHQTVSQSSAGASGWWQWPPKCGTRWTIIDRRQTGSWRVRNVERQSHQLWGCRVRLSLHTHTELHTATHTEHNVIRWQYKTWRLCTSVFGTRPTLPIFFNFFKKNLILKFNSIKKWLKRDTSSALWATKHGNWVKRIS